MADLDKSVEKAIDDHLKRIYDRYKTNTKVFNATHISHIVLGVIFIFAILLPFLFIQVDNQRTTEQMDALREKVTAQEAVVASYQKATAGMAKVFEAVKNTPKPLKAYIQALEAEADSSVPAPAPEGAVGETVECGDPGPDRDPWMECRIHAYMKGRFETYRDILRKEVADPLALMNITGFDQWHRDLETGMEDLREEIRGEMGKNPRFWREFDETSPVYRAMVDRVNQFWETHDFEAIGRRLEAEAAPLKADIESLQKRQEENQARNDILNSRLKNFKTSFGKFGLEVKTAILVSPIFLGAIFMVASVNLAESIKLRASFQRFYHRHDPDKIAITDADFALSAPLWVDPLDPERKRTARIVFLLMPAVVFVVALGVVLYCWTLPGAFPDMTGFDYGKYIVFYILSGAAFVVGFRKVMGEVRRYSSEPFVPDAAPKNPDPSEG
jgi:hypothetical protein